tara:strand:- start:20574 stop:20852 length:279 start_codon:yes stop_codon:yes gene_type:complete
MTTATDTPTTQPRVKGSETITAQARVPMRLTYDMVDGRPVIKTVHLLDPADPGGEMFLDATGLLADISPDEGKTLLRDDVVRIQIAASEGTI